MRSFLFIYLCTVLFTQVFAQIVSEKEYEQRDSFFDPKEDYSKFPARITDRDTTAHIYKMTSSNGNIKFFRAGDELFIRPANSKRDMCRAYIRSSEKDYVVMYVNDITTCSGLTEYLRRGTLLECKSADLDRRVRDASFQRLVLIKRKEGLYAQLSKINKFIWSFEEQKALTIADFDKRLAELEKAKQEAIEFMWLKKKDSLSLQVEMQRRIRDLEEDLEHHRIEKNEMLVDRWFHDHDAGLPVQSRPQEPRLKKEARIKL